MVENVFHSRQFAHAAGGDGPWFFAADDFQILARGKPLKEGLETFLERFGNESRKVFKQVITGFATSLDSFGKTFRCFRQNVLMFCRKSIVLLDNRQVLTYPQPPLVVSKAADYRCEEWRTLFGLPWYFPFTQNNCARGFPRFSLSKCFCAYSSLENIVAVVLPPSIFITIHGSE